MDDEKLKEIWEQMMKETFTAFIDKHVGWEDTKAQKPACFGSGDSMPWCRYCGLVGAC